MNTFSENGNDFVGRLLHKGGVSRRTFSAFPETQTASTVIPTLSARSRSGDCSTTGPSPGRRGFRTTRRPGERARGERAPSTSEGAGSDADLIWQLGSRCAFAPPVRAAALRPHGAAAREGGAATGLGAQRGGLTDARGQPNRDNTEQRKTLSRTSSANKWLRCDPAVRARGEPPRAGARGASARCGAPAPRFRA
jgi:hypothetical protein